MSVLHRTPCTTFGRLASVPSSASRYLRSELAQFRIKKSAQASIRRSTRVTKCTQESGKPEDEIRKEAARYIVDAYVRNGMTVGLGSAGPGARAVIEYLGSRVEAGTLENVSAVATDKIAASEAACAGVPLTALSDQTKLDLFIDSADTVQYSRGELAFIKGLPRDQLQPDILMEKAMAAEAGLFLVMAEEALMVPSMCGVVPVVVEAERWEDIAEELDDQFLMEATVWRRPSSGREAPHGGEYPHMDAAGCNFLDLRFEEPFGDRLADIVRTLEATDGVVGHGVYLNGAALGGVAVTKENYVPLYPDPVKTNTETA